MELKILKSKKLCMVVNCSIYYGFCPVEMNHGARPILFSKRYTNCQNIKVKFAETSLLHVILIATGETKNFWYEISLKRKVKKVKMVGIYFSGTGNTKFCVERFLGYYKSGAKAYSIEDGQAADVIKRNSEIVFAYPVYFSSMPKMVFDFIEENCSLFSGKKIFVIATMGLFSGDGAGCSARLFTKYGADITGGLHLKMPDCIGLRRH